MATLLGAGPESWSGTWAVPLGSLSLRLDPLASVFILPICLVGGACALYGGAYLRPCADERPVGAPLAGYNLLLASMTVVCLADNLLLFLVAWELMTLSSYALVVHEHGLESVREAGRRYLIAAHLATAALLLLVLLLSADCGSLELSDLSPGTAAAPTALLFLLALAGFGTKAGIVPLHVWLPDAHPAAPSHVSALMSAVMVTMGFYGLARFIPLLGPPPLWWGLALMALGAAGALGGIAFALAQRDVKRILAYSTIENAGIIALAFGVGLLGTALDQPALAALGWLGGLLHLWNHALFKSLLFLGYGAAAQRVHSRDAEAMGGLLRRWPLTGGLMVVGAAAITALPGLNGFTSEWVLFYGLLTGRGGAAGYIPDRAARRCAGSRPDGRTSGRLLRPPDRHRAAGGAPVRGCAPRGGPGLGDVAAHAPARGAVRRGRLGTGPGDRAAGSRRSRSWRGQPTWARWRRR